jgi:hypothetical protein
MLDVLVIYPRSFGLHDFPTSHLQPFFPPYARLFPNSWISLLISLVSSQILRAAKPTLVIHNIHIYLYDILILISGGKTFVYFYFIFILLFLYIISRCFSIGRTDWNWTN